MSEAHPAPPSSPLRQVHLVFEQFKLVRVGVIVVLIDLYGSWYLLDSLNLQPARALHVGLLLILIGIAVWRCIRHRNDLLRYRHEFIAGLEPGWFMVGKDGCVKRSLVDDGVESSGEQEMVSLSDQGGRQAKLWCFADVVFYLVMVWIFLPPDKGGQFFQIELRLAIWSLLLAILVRWAVWGNAFFAGVNRLAIDPVEWSWGGWWRRLAKGGRWEDTRVLIKPMTKHGQYRYFLVIGHGDQSIGMIVPKGSVDLLWHAYVNGEITPATSSPDDSDPCPAS